MTDRYGNPENQHEQPSLDSNNRNSPRASSPYHSKISSTPRTLPGTATAAPAGTDPAGKSSARTSSAGTGVLTLETPAATARPAAIAADVDTAPGTDTPRAGDDSGATATGWSATTDVRNTDAALPNDGGAGSPAG